MGDLDGILGSGDDMVKSTNGIKMIKKVVYFALTWHAGGKGSWDLLTSVSIYSIILYEISDLPLALPQGSPW